MSSKMEWTRDKTFTLIEEYKKRRGLWDMTHDDYRKKDIKKELLNEVAEKIDNHAFPITEIEKKFHTLRTQYHREINRMRQNNSNGEYKSKWFAFKQLEFLNSPRACRSSKGDSKSTKTTQSPEMKKETIGYIIKEYQIEEENPADGITTELVIQKRPTPPSKHRDRTESRKELEKLIEETTKDVDDETIVDEIPEERDYKHTPKSSIKNITIHPNFVHHSNIQTIEHYLNENDNQSHNIENINSDQNTTIIQHDGNEYHTTSTTQQPSIIRIQKRDISSVDSSYDDDHHQAKKYFYEPVPHQQRNFTVSGLPGRDEFSIYGEYVANEMRIITNRNILVKLKHKINVALFEASMSQLQKPN